MILNYNLKYKLTPVFSKNLITLYKIVSIYKTYKPVMTSII